MAPRYCQIDGRPWGTCTSPGYVPPLPPKPLEAETDDETDRRRIADPEAAVRVFVNRPTRLPDAG
jgi:hypothetical protein